MISMSNTIGNVSAALASLIPGVLFIVGQADSSVLSGASGWAGAGILGLVLAWLFFKHLPDKDALLERAQAGKDKQLSEKDTQIQNLIVSHNQREDKARETYERNVALLTEHCEREMQVMSDGVGKKVDTIASMIDSLNKLVDSLQRAQQHVERTAQVQRENK